MKPPVVLLGPQRLKPTLAAAVRELGVENRLATITAGWQEREPEDSELHYHLDGRTINLRLYQRAEEIFRRDAEFAGAHKRRQERLRHLQNLYELRLGHYMDAVMQLLRREGDPYLVDPAREEAIETVRRLDQDHLDRVKEVHQEFEETWQPGARDLIAHERRQVKEILKTTGGLCIAGGHLAVLLNRLRLFDVASMIGSQPVFAWSGGAMVVSDRIVLFHDNPPQGKGNAELLDYGLGLLENVVCLPHAYRRLNLDDPSRVSRLVRRFRPSLCVALADGSQLRWAKTGWRGAGGVHQLLWDGSLVELIEGEAA